MFFWEQAITGFLDGIGLRSIKSKIIAFALFATLLPSVTMGWISSAAPADPGPSPSDTITAASRAALPRFMPASLPRTGLPLRNESQ